jgi:hypothetical protein
MVSLDPRTLACDSPDGRAEYPAGRLATDQLGTSNLAPLVVGAQINTALASNHIRLIKDTRGRRSQLSSADIAALRLCRVSLE